MNSKYVVLPPRQPRIEPFDNVRKAVRARTPPRQCIETPIWLDEQGGDDPSRPTERTDCLSVGAGSVEHPKRVVLDAITTWAPKQALSVAVIPGRPAWRFHGMKLADYLSDAGKSAG